MASIVNRFSRALRTWTGSRKTRFPILTEGKYFFDFHSLKVLSPGLVSGSVKTSSSAVLTPTNVGSCFVVVALCEVMLRIEASLSLERVTAEIFSCGRLPSRGGVCPVLAFRASVERFHARSRFPVWLISYRRRVAMILDKQLAKNYDLENPGR